MGSEKPVNADADEERPQSTEEINPATGAMLQQALRDAPLQTHRWEDYIEEQPETERDHSRRSISFGTWLRLKLLGSRESEGPQPKLCMKGPNRYQDVVDSSLKHAVKTTLESFPQRPPNDTLSSDEIVIMLGDFFAERLSYRGKLLPGDAVSATRVRQIYRGFTSPRNPIHDPQVVETPYQHCLSDHPEGMKYNITIPTAIADMLRQLTKSWPKTLRQADLLHEIRCAPKISHWSWLHEGRNIEAKDMFAFTRIPAAPNGMRLARTTGQVKTGEKLTGSICFMFLNEIADMLSFGELVQSASHLLEETLYVGDPIDEEERFGKLDKFYLPLLSQLEPGRGNEAWGPWSNCCGSFSSIFHHLRCLGDEPSCMSPLLVDGSNGFTLNRVCRRFSTKVGIWVGERRISIAVLARYHQLDTGQQGLKRYNGLLLVSPGSDGLENWSGTPHELAHSTGLVPVDGIFAPVFCFLTLFSAAIGVWTVHWWNFVDGVERLLQDDDIFSHKDLHGLSKGSTDVEGYFDIIRLLRTAICWIESTEVDFDAAESSMMKTEQSHLENYDVMSDNFDVVRNDLKEEIEQLTTKLGRMLHDVKTLRQDLQTAASLREISGANRVNEHLRFLAILTTVYLPLNLLAAVCGNSISIEFDQIRQSLSLALCGLALVVVTYAFPWVHNRVLDHRRNSCDECPEGSRAHGAGPHRHPTSKRQGTYDTVRGSFKSSRSFPIRSPNNKAHKNAQTSEDVSSEDRSAVELV